MKKKEEQQTADKVTAAAEAMTVILQDLTDTEAAAALGRAVSITKRIPSLLYILVLAMTAGNAEKMILTLKRDGKFSVDFLAPDGKSLTFGNKPA